MTRWDLVDEAVIEGTPQEAWDALMAAERGETDWWEPYLRMRPRGPQRKQVGDAFDLRVNAKGGLERWDTARFHGVGREADEPHHLRVEYLGGAFRGTADWTFEAVDPVRTRVRVRWQVDPAGMMRLWSRLMDVADAHHAVMRRGFEQMEAHLRSHRVGGAV